jgi:hypothetical protein
MVKKCPVSACTYVAPKTGPRISGPALASLNAKVRSSQRKGDVAGQQIAQAALHARLAGLEVPVTRCPRHDIMLTEEN